LGGKTKVVINLDNIHLFDAETEVVIRDNPAPNPQVYEISKASRNVAPH
jgi:hypothetical protein